MPKKKKKKKKKKNKYEEPNSWRISHLHRPHYNPSGKFG
jgi:hypothetical protein